MKTLLLIAISILPFGMLLSQGKGKGKGAEQSVEVRSENNAKWIQKKTGASEDQFAKIKATNVTYFTSVRALRGKTDLSKDQRKAEIEKLKSERDASLKLILTAEQWSVLEKSRTENKAKKDKVKKEKKAQVKKAKKEKAKKEKKAKKAKSENDSDTEEEELNEDE